ncbi:MAG: DUF4292 domain-containing protein [Bacteroidales bacterium]|nr:DUF4292 domain-containing protein [Bacteroidales bacterium]
MNVRLALTLIATALLATACTSLKEPSAQKPDGGHEAITLADPNSPTATSQNPSISTNKPSGSSNTGSENAPNTDTYNAAEAVAAAPMYETMTVSCGYDGLAATGQVRMQRDSAIWVSVSYFFELGRVLATPDSVRIDVKVAGKSFRGTYADLARVTGVRTNFDELQALMRRDTAAEELTALAHKLGYNIKIKLSNRKTATGLQFPM